MRVKTTFTSEQQSLLLLSQKNKLRQDFFDVLVTLLSLDPRDRLFERVGYEISESEIDAFGVSFSSGPTRFSKKHVLIKKLDALINQVEDDSDFLDRLAALEHHINPEILNKARSGTSSSEKEAEEYFRDWDRKIWKRYKEWQSYEKGELSVEAFNKVEGSFQEWFTQEINRNLWSEHYSHFTDEFVRYINQKYFPS